MKKRASAAIIGGIILLLVAAFIITKFYDPTPEKSEVKSNEGLQLSIVKDNRAALYISQDAENLEKKNGKGSVVFIDDTGHVKGFPINPVEYGEVKFVGNQFMVEESNQMTLTTDHIQKTTFDELDFRGTRASYLEETNQFYAIYNSGLSKKHDYQMTIRYTDRNNEFNTLLVPHFVSTSGNDADHVMLLTQDLISMEYQLKKVKLKKDAEVKTIAQLEIPNAANFDSISQIVALPDAYYFVGSYYESDQYENIVLVRIDRKTAKLKMTTLAEYRSEKETMNSFPLSFNESLYLFENNFYFLNGLGKVIRYNVDTGKVNEAFTVQGLPVKNDYLAQATFKDGHLHFIYEDAKKKHFLDEYSLKTGKRTRSIPVKGLKKYIDDEAFMMTDLTMLQDHPK